MIIKYSISTLLILSLSLRGWWWEGIGGGGVGLFLALVLSSMLIESRHRRLGGSPPSALASWRLTRPCSDLARVIVYGACLATVFFALFPRILGSEIGNMCRTHYDQQVVIAKVSLLLENPNFSEVTPIFDLRKFYGVKFQGKLNSRREFEALRTEMRSTVPEVSPRWIWWEIVIQESNERIDKTEFWLNSNAHDA